MKGKISALTVLTSQALLVGLFCFTNFNDEISIEKRVSTIHNDNLNKIASSVSLLFEEEILPVNNYLDDLILEELPSIDVVVEEKDEAKKEEVDKTTPLVSVDASKYINNIPIYEVENEF